MRWIAVLSLLVAVACQPVPQGQTPPPTQKTAPAPQRLSESQQIRNFQEIIRRVEPVAEDVCRRETRGLDCDFKIVLDDNRRAPPNAFQTLDKNNRPIIVFTLALVKAARNQDELAFVLGHETAHHIENHLGRQRQSAIAGALIFGNLASITGANAGTVQSAQELGALVGSRTYSKEFELEADRLGTVITARAGYDPVRGAEFFNRIPDPGDRFLGTHPPNAQRIEAVRQTVRGL
ncbi:M48 family metalloprotease [Nereida sp. MMG025]|uniref:M48 family metalloprotease n=1 Tax=Nereida sp. MMG025 TaxID=2909981 RepID=UPI001F02C5F8|nr:M48 family metalloprotease [Nereida sp. MMG025]MCF6444049.1 M48 family metalloprotease [Nereida sp. MMG025]